MRQGAFSWRGPFTLLGDGDVLFQEIGSAGRLNSSKLHERVNLALFA